MNPLPLIGVGAGVVQSIVGGIKSRKAEKQMEKMVNSYQPNRSILDYYNKALSRYSQNPYETNLYKTQEQQANRSLNTGLFASNRGRGGTANINSLVQGRNDALLKAGATAEGQQAQALSQLGGATQMKAEEEFKPFEMKYNLQGQKAAGGARLMNAGLSNIFQGLGAASNSRTMRREYGNNSDVTGMIPGN